MKVPAYAQGCGVAVDAAGRPQDVGNAAVIAVLWKPEILPQVKVGQKALVFADGNAPVSRGRVIDVSHGPLVSEQARALYGISPAAASLMEGSFGVALVGLDRAANGERRPGREVICMDARIEFASASLSGQR